jgi:pimeloyl-ACP methyl ester carboxylesterase
METGTRYQKVAAILSRRFRVIRLRCRQYRLDLKKDTTLGDWCTVAQEVEHVLATLKMIDGPAVICGHSSGGPVALESLLASPSSFAGAVIYEPACVIGMPGNRHLGYADIPRDGDVGEGLRRARAALAAGKPGKAVGMFTTIAAGWPGWAAHIAQVIPSARHVVLHGHGHAAHVKAPEHLARVIEAHADTMLRQAKD